MKEGWEYKKLGEICRVINGRAYSKDEMLNQGKYRLLRVGNFFTNDSWYYSDLELEEDKYCDNGDLLYAWSASFGPRIWNGEKVIYHYHIWKMVCSEEIDKFFLCYWLDSDELKKQTMTNLHGATMAHITKRIIENAIVSYPSLSEQQSIVDYLDSAFAKIDAMKANAEKALNEAQALFQASLKEMLEPKEGWEENTLKELGQTQTGTTPSKSDKDNYGDYISFIRPSEIDYDGSGRIEYNSALKLSKKGADNGRIFDTHSIFMVCIGATIGKVGYGERAISCNQQINIFTPNNSVNYKFAYYAMKNDGFQQKVIKEGTSSQATLPIINKGKWEKLTISYPPLSEQQSIVATLDSLKSKVDRLQANYDKISQECDALKQAILRQVFE